MVEGSSTPVTSSLPKISALVRPQMVVLHSTGHVLVSTTVGAAVDETSRHVAATIGVEVSVTARVVEAEHRGVSVNYFDVASV